MVVFVLYMSILPAWLARVGAGGFSGATTLFMCKLLNINNFISMLPLAGHDGSLQYRAGLHQAGVDGKVSAKTGSLQGVYNLAGFITTASGQRMAFVQYLSGYAVPPADQRNRRIPLVRFESRLYKDIYQNN